MNFSHRQVVFPAMSCFVLVFAVLPISAGTDGEILQRMTVTVSPEDQAKLKESRPQAAAALAQVEISRMSYLSDGLKVNGYLVEPKSGTKLPCLIFNRGGNRDFGALSDLRAAALLATIAAHGYVVVAPQYRGVAGGEGVDEFGGREVGDVLNLVGVLERLPRADASRIGMMGWSRGGMMTYLALKQTDRIRAAIVGAGVADVPALLEARPEMETVFSELVPGWSERRGEEMAKRSAVTWAESLPAATPILILQGTADWRVGPQQALDMATALQKAKRPYRLVMLEGGDHGLSEHRAEVDRLVIDWLDRYVRDGEPLPDLEPHGR